MEYEDNHNSTGQKKNALYRELLKYEQHTEFTKGQIVYLKVKRVLDIFLAIILLLPAFFVTTVFAVWIKSESKGPIFFTQKRPGYRKRIFSIYKLRSMKIETVDGSGRFLSDKERLTKSGYWARRTSADELPQLINILKGEMSFIGPRPQLINDLPTFTDEQMCRFDILPGITSLPAIHGRNNQPIAEKYNWDTYYVKHISFMLDLKIFIKTVLLVFSQKDIDDEINDVIPAGKIINEDKI